MRVLVACEFSGTVRRAFQGIAEAMASQWGSETLPAPHEVKP